MGQPVLEQEGGVGLLQGVVGELGQELVPHRAQHRLEPHGGGLEDHHQVLVLAHHAELAEGAVSPEDALSGAAPELEAVPGVPVRVAGPQARGGVVDLLGGGHLEPLLLQQLAALPLALVCHELDEPGHVLHRQGVAVATGLGAVYQGLAADVLGHAQGPEQPGL